MIRRSIGQGVLTFSGRGLERFGVKAFNPLMKKGPIDKKGGVKFLISTLIYRQIGAFKEIPDMFLMRFIRGMMPKSITDHLGNFFIEDVFLFVGIT